MTPQSAFYALCAPSVAALHELELSFLRAQIAQQQQTIADLKRQIETDRVAVIRAVKERS